MNQIFGFKRQFVNKILTGEKFLTTRLRTDYRTKCRPGDLMHVYSGLRTKNCKKICTARVRAVFKWNQGVLLNQEKIFTGESPIGISWEEFARGEGFKNVMDFMMFFYHPRYANKDLITYWFDVEKIVLLDEV